MKKLSRIAYAALAGAAMLAALPAAARPTPIRSNHVWNDIVQLERDVNRADARDTISEREAAGLRAQIAELKADYNRLKRNGLSPANARALENRIHQLRARLGNEKHDPDNHRG